MTAEADRLDALVRKFEAGKAFYTSSASGYQEAEVRSEFIDPFLRAFGWDIENLEGLAPEVRDVVREETQSDSSSVHTRPDYSMRVLGYTQFFIEAKKPSIDIRNSRDSAFQARAYGWSGGHPISVLTNFETIRVFDASVPVSDTDTADTALIFECGFVEFVRRRTDLEELIGRAAVVRDDWLDGWVDKPERQIYLPADQRFIQQWNIWRRYLGGRIIAKEPGMSSQILNDVVQEILNRLIFLRMCEDRHIEEPHSLLKATLGGAEVTRRFFVAKGRRFGPLLYRQNDPFEPLNLVPQEALVEVVEGLYPPKSPFSFAVLDADFLGQVYESTLAEHLQIKSSEVTLATKNEYVKRDVVVTPQWLVSLTVDHAFKAKSRSSVQPTVLDFAVGSGRFLLSAFDHLVRREVEVRRYRASNQGLRNNANADPVLTFEVKKHLVQKFCYGIDIDFNAVIMTRFALMMKLLEGESRLTLPRQGALFSDFSGNIVHGNTLVRSVASDVSEELRTMTQPVTWESLGVPENFDIILGNPPYMNTEEMRKYNLVEFEYIKKNYRSAIRQFDKYFAFVEFALAHLTKTGVIGVVIPNKWMTIESATEFRSLLRSSASIAYLANFGHLQLFEKKSVYVCSLVLSVPPFASVAYAEPKSISMAKFGQVEWFQTNRSDLSADNEAALVLPANKGEKNLLSSIVVNSVPLGTVGRLRNGVQTSANRIMILKEFRETDELIEFERDGVTWSVEKELTRPYVDDSASVMSHRFVKADARIVFPYWTTEDELGRQRWVVIPEAQMETRYPLAFKYLSHFRSKLSKRSIPAAEKRKAFYVYGRTQAIEWCTDAPKILYTNNQRGDKYALDVIGTVYQSGGTAGEVAIFPGEEGYSLDFILALLDQTEIEFFLSKRGSSFRGGYTARGTAVIADVPVPVLDFDSPADQSFHDEVSSEMAQLRDVVEQMDRSAPRDRAQLTTVQLSLKSSIGSRFRARWGLEESDPFACTDS